MLAFAFGLLLRAQTDIPYWIYVSVRDPAFSLQRTIDASSWTEIVKRGIPGATFKTRNNLGCAFEDALWQGDAMAAQDKLYESVQEFASSGTPGAQIADFVSETLRTSGRRESGAGKVTLVIERTFFLTHDGRKIELSTGKPQPDRAVVDVLPVVRSYDHPGEKWVHYPTFFSFYAHSSKYPPPAVDPTDNKLRAQVAALDILDEHIDAFMVTRQAKRARIEKDIDGLEANTMEHKAVSELDDAVKKRLLAEASATLPPGLGSRPPDWIEAWIKAATVERVSTTIFLETQDATGASVDVEVP